MENKEYLVVVMVCNRPAVLNRITTPFLKRHVNIESLNSQESEVRGVSKVAMKVCTSSDVVERVALQLDSIYDVVDVKYYPYDQLLTLELALFKVPAEAGGGLLADYKDEFDLRVAHSSQECMVLELSGTGAQVDRFVEVLQSKNILKEYSRSANVSIPL